MAGASVLSRSNVAPRIWDSEAFMALRRERPSASFLRREIVPSFRILVSVGLMYVEPESQTPNRGSRKYQALSSARATQGFGRDSKIPRGFLDLSGPSLTVATPRGFS